MTQLRLKHQGRGRLAPDLWQGPSRETMDQTGTKWSQPEHPSRFGSWCAVLRLPQAYPAVPSIAFAVLPAVFTGTSLGGIEDEEGHAVPEAIRGRGPGGQEVRRPIRSPFAFISADPNTDWLARSDVILGAEGLTWAALGKTSQLSPTNVPGQLAIGGVRSGLAKRVAAAAGEGAKVAVALLALPAAAVPSGAAVGQH